MILNILSWIQLKKDLLEIWLLNGTVATLILTNLPTAIVSISGLITIGYTIWKWRKEYRESNKNKDVSKHSK